MTHWIELTVSPWIHIQIASICCSHIARNTCFPPLTYTLALFVLFYKLYNKHFKFSKHWLNFGSHCILLVSFSFQYSCIPADHSLFWLHASTLMVNCYYPYFNICADNWFRKQLWYYTVSISMYCVTNGISLTPMFNEPSYVLLFISQSYWKPKGLGFS